MSQTHPMSQFPSMSKSQRGARGPSLAATSRLRAALVAAMAAIAPLACLALAQGDGLSSNATVYATGLDNPRGLAFGPDGTLYVAEGGTGGDTATTADQCEQVLPPVGPYLAGGSSRISKIGSDGTRTTVVDGLPSSQTAADSGGFVSGVGAVAFLGDTLYAVLAGAGCSHGVLGVPNEVIEVHADGSWTPVADMSAFYMAHPVQTPNPGDFEPDGTPYSMVGVDGKLYVVEPNHGSLEEVSPDGTIRRMVDVSASRGHAVPSSLTYHDGTFYVGTLGVIPFLDGSSAVYAITPDGQLSDYATGVTTALGVAFGAMGELYVLESTTGGTGDPPFFLPGSGKIVRVASDGSQTVVASGFTFPTAMVMGDDGALYVSNCGYGCKVGEGQVVRVTLP